MAHLSEDWLEADGRRNWLRLRVLVRLRWWACLGQSAALVVARQAFDITLRYDLCVMVIGVLVISNLVAIFVYPQTKRLNKNETFGIVLFDLLQLGALLYLTGGLNNPFSILIVGPVTVSAAALRWQPTAWLAAVAIAIVTALVTWYQPMYVASGHMLEVPDLFRFGNWLAIVIAVAFQGVYAYRMVTEMQTMSDALLAMQLALSREQKLTAVAGVVAATAHELGTPLATIKLTSNELVDELTDHPDLREDAVLIREQADRCRDILHSMGIAGKDDPHMRAIPLSAMLELAAEPHLDRGKHVIFETDPTRDGDSRQPVLPRTSEIIHGLRNLVQNAVDFSNTTVWIESGWDARRISVRVMDDGDGYPPQLLGRIGEPYLRDRSGRSDRRRPEYESMGLGLFVAKNLLERTGATISFANGPTGLRRKFGSGRRLGAVVHVIWDRKALEAGIAGIARGE